MLRPSRFLALFTLLIFTAPLILAQADHFRPTGSITGFDTLLNLNAVRQELKLTDDQTIKVLEVVREVRQKHRNDLEKLRPLSKEDRGQKLPELMETVSQETLKELGTTLTAEQTRRLQQVRRQQRGLRAFTEPEAEKALELTAEQKEKIKALEEREGRQIAELFQNGPRGNFRETLQKSAEISRQSTLKAVAVLSDRQQAAWKELVGPPFDIKLDRLVAPVPEADTKKTGDKDKE